MKTSPTQLSLRTLRQFGYTAQVVERWNAYAKVRQDLFGFIDIVAINDLNGVLGVQSTSDGNVSSRLRKIKENANAKRWLDAGNRIVVHGWKLHRGRYACRVVQVTEI